MTCAQQLAYVKIIHFHDDYFIATYRYNLFGFPKNLVTQYIVYNIQYKP